MTQPPFHIHLSSEQKILNKVPEGELIFCYTVEDKLLE